MTKQRLFRTVAAIAACLALALPASAYDFMKDGIYYNISGTNATVTYKTTSYNSYSGTVNIPATVTNGGTTYNVTSIGPSAFQNCTNLRRVVIPNSVTYIMNDAFKGCTGLRTITIPASVYSIYNNVFDGCTVLKSVICLNPSPRPWNANNFNSTTYTSAKLIVPQGSLSAYQSSTYCWGSFTSIQEMDCDFVEDAMFYDILDDNKVEITHALRFAEDYSGDIVIPSTVTHNGATYTVTSIGNNAFHSNYSLYSISVPATVNNISQYAFYNCPYLTSVNIPEGITDINYCLFGCCSSLPSIVIPSSVTWIAQNAFNGCESLTDITCRAANPPMCVDSSCFPSEAYSNATLKVPSASLNSYQTTSVWSNFYNIVGQNYDFVYNGIYYNITGPNTAEVTFKDNNYNSYSGAVNVPSTVMHNGTTYTVTAVGQAAFYKCTELTSVTLPNTLTALGYGAFANSTNLTSVNIPSGVTSLGEFCFQGCSSLTSINIPSGVTSIPRQCFLNCSSLTHVTIPGTVKEVYYFAFYNCTSMNSLTIQNGVESILNNAFESCTSLQSVTIPASVSTIAGNVFAECTSLTAINVNSGNTHYTSQDGVLFDAPMDTLISFPNMSTATYSVPAGVKVIGYNSFLACSNLVSVSLPEGLTTIDVTAFAYCENLASFYIPASVNTVGVRALEGCSSLTSIEVAPGNQNYMSDDGVLYTIDGKNLLQYPGSRPDKHYSILNSTDSIFAGSFYKSSYLKSVYIPAGIKTLPTETFMYSNVERVVIDEGLETIEMNTFAGCYQLKSVYLPSTLREIENYAFQVDTELEEITFAGSTPPTIGSSIFHYVGADLDEPVTLYVPAGSESAYNNYDWGSYGFSSNAIAIQPLDSGTEFTVDSLIYVTTDASLNTKVSSVTSKNLYDPGIPPKVAHQGNLCTVTLLGDHSLAYCTKMVRADVPFTVQKIDSYAAYGCTKLEQLTLREGLKEIGGFAFSHDNNLTKVSIPASVDTIKGDAFTYDPMLYQINVAKENTKYTSVDGILFSKDKKRLVAFADGHGEEYTVPIGTQIIDVEAFRGASVLTAVNLPIGLKRIDRLAFMDCSALTALEMPSTLTSLGYSAFSNAPLTTLTVKAKTPPTCEIRIEPHSGTVSEPFNNTHYNNCTLIVPRGSKSAYQNAAVWKKFNNIVEADLPTDYIRGDVNNDGVVGMDDLTALINYLVFNDASSINLNAADTNEDGVVGMDDLTTLINYLVFNTWPAPAPIDMWYLWGNFIGEIPWGDVHGNSPIGVSALPLYPTGTFNAQGKGLLTWTGYIPRQYFTIVHSAGYYDDLASEVWMVDQNGNYLVTSIDEGNNNGYINFLLDDGYYTIYLNTATMNLSIESTEIDDISFGSICMVGTFNDWSNTANPMETVNPNLGLSNSDWWVGTWTITQTNAYGDVKFCNYNDWDYNWGADAFPYGCGEQSGPNIPATPGTYKVFFNDITGQYNFIKME